MRPTGVRYIVLAWMCLFAMLAYVHRSAIAVPASLIQDELGLSKEEMAVAMSMFLWGYATLQLPGGLLADRWGSRLVLPLLVVVSALANGLLGLATGLWWLLACRFVMGMAQAGLFPGAVKTFSQWFPASERAFPSGMLAGFMSVGGVLASAVTGLLLGFISWRAIQVVYALPCLALAAWFFIWFRDRPGQHPLVNDAERHWIEGDAVPTLDISRPVTPWRRIFTSPSMACICGQQFCRGAGYIFYVTWLPTFLQETQGVNVSASGYLTSLPLLAVVFGSPTGGLLMDWLYRRTGSKWLSRKGLALINLALAGGLLGLAYFTTTAWLAVGLITLSGFFAGLCGPCAYTATIDFGGRHVATVFSLMNMAGNIGAAILPLVVVPVAEEAGWDMVLWLLAGLYAGAVACWIGLNVNTRLDIANESKPVLVAEPASEQIQVLPTQVHSKN